MTPSRIVVVPGSISAYYSCCGKPRCGAHEHDCQGYDHEVELMDPQTWRESRA